MFLRNSKFILFLVYIIIWIIALGSFGFGLTLPEAVQLAKERNPDILAVKSSWQAIRAQAVQMGTWMDPKLELMYEQIPQGSGNLSDAGMRMWGISQMVPFPGKPSLKRSAADQMALSAEQKYKAKTNEIVARVKSAYYQLFLANKAIEINNENKGILKKFAKIAEAKYIVGQASQHDVLKAQLELSLLIDNLITLEQDKHTAKVKLAALLNTAPSEITELADTLSFPDFDLKADELETFALKNKPELESMRYMLEQSETALTLAKMSYLPDFGIKLLQREMKPSGLNGWNATFMFDIPLWFWREAGAVSEAGYNRESAEASYKNMKNMVVSEVQELFVKVDSARRSMRLLETSILPQAEQMLKVTTQAYEANRVDFLTLMNSSKMLFDAKLKYYKAQTNFGTALANLEKIIAKELI